MKETLTARWMNTCSPWYCAQSLFSCFSYFCSFGEGPNRLRPGLSNHRKPLPHRQCRPCIQMYRLRQACLSMDVPVRRGTPKQTKTAGTNQEREVMKLQPMSLPSSASASKFNCLVRPSSSHVFDMSRVTAPSPPSPI